MPWIEIILEIYWNMQRLGQFTGRSIGLQNNVSMGWCKTGVTPVR